MRVTHKGTSLKAFQNGTFYKAFKRRGRKSIGEYCNRKTQLGVSKISPPDVKFELDSKIGFHEN